MSDNIPFDIQTEIIKMVSDVKSLLQFRAVSKSWKSLIDNSEFIARYRARKSQPYSFLLSYKDNSNELKCFSVNNHTFKVQQDLASNVFPFMQQFYDLRVVGYSLGLCLYSYGTLVLWNPSLRRFVGILGADHFDDVFGFAVCPVTDEPTIVKVSLSPWKVQNFTLSSKKWTEIQCREPRESIILHDESHIVIGRCIYQVAYERISLPDFYSRNQYIIVSFDFITKEFKAIGLPYEITNPCAIRLFLSKLKGSLVVVVPRDREVKVWKMEPDCSFTQLFTINSPGSPITYIVGFRKNGELLVERQKIDDGVWDSALKVYDLCSHQINNLEFSGLVGSFFVIFLSRKHCICLITRILMYILNLIDHRDYGCTK